MRRRQAFARSGETRVAPPFDRVATYTARFGRPRHHRMKIDTILARLNDGDIGDRGPELREATRPGE